MTQQLEKAKEILADGGYTCVITDGICCHTSRQRGVAPLLAWYDQQTDLEGFAAADRVVGKAAAFLYVLLRIRSVYAGIMSVAALEVLERHHIDVHYGTLVEGIRNRTDTGPCPMENATRNCTQPIEAVSIIRAVQKKLRAETGVSHLSGSV